MSKSNLLLWGGIGIVGLLLLSSRKAKASSSSDATPESEVKRIVKESDEILHGQRDAYSPPADLAPSSAPNLAPSVAAAAAQASMSAAKQMPIAAPLSEPIEALPTSVQPEAAT